MKRIEGILDFKRGCVTLLNLLTQMGSDAVPMLAPVINNEYSLKCVYIQFRLYGMCAEDNAT